MMKQLVPRFPKSAGTHHPASRKNSKDVTLYWLVTCETFKEKHDNFYTTCNLKMCQAVNQHNFCSFTKQLKLVGHLLLEKNKLDRRRGSRVNILKKHKDSKTNAGST